MLVKVTQNNIDDGKIYSSKECPISLAMRNKNIKNFHSVYVYPGTILLYTKKDIEKKSSWYNLPLKARDFLTNFNTGKKVSPIQFTARRVKNG